MCQSFCIEAPVIDIGVIDQTLNEGDTALFTCQATGIPIPNISWYFNGAQVVKTDAMKYMLSEESFNPTTKNSTLKIVDLDSSDIGRYTCNATNIVTSDTSCGMLAINRKSINN